MVEGGGFEPPKAMPTDLQSVPFDRSGTPPHLRVRGLVRVAPRHRSTRIATSRLRQAPAIHKTIGGLPLSWRRDSNPQPLITNEMLYQLSYASGPWSSRKEEQRQDRQPAGAVKMRPTPIPGRAGPVRDFPPGQPTLRPPAKRQPSRVNRSPPLWLPLPERTGGDREEPHCSPGFVDRAYLVFLLKNYEPLLHQRDTDRIEAALTPFSLGP